MLVSCSRVNEILLDVGVVIEAVMTTGVEGEWGDDQGRWTTR